MPESAGSLPIGRARRCSRLFEILFVILQLRGRALDGHSGINTLEGLGSDRFFAQLLRLHRDGGQVFAAPERGLADRRDVFVQREGGQGDAALEGVVPDLLHRRSAGNRLQLPASGKSTISLCCPFTAPLLVKNILLSVDGLVKRDDFGPPFSSDRQRRLNRPGFRSNPTRAAAKSESFVDMMERTMIFFLFEDIPGHEMSSGRRAAA